MHHILPPVQSTAYAQAALATDARAPRRIAPPRTERTVPEAEPSDPDRDADGQHQPAEREPQPAHERHTEKPTDATNQQGLGEHLDLQG